MFAPASALFTLALALSAQAAPSYPLPFRSSRLPARAAVPVENAPATLSPYYANVPAESGSTHQYSEVYVTPQYYVVPPSGVSYTPEDRFTTIMVQTTSDGASSGYLVYGYGGQSATLISPTTKYSITNPAVELTSFSLPAVAQGSAPVTLTSYLFKEPASVNRVIFSRASFDVEKYRVAAGLGEALAVNTINVINGQAGAAAPSAPASSSTSSSSSASASSPAAPEAISVSLPAPKPLTSMATTPGMTSTQPAPGALSSSSTASQAKPTGTRPGQAPPPFYSVLPVLTKPACKR